MVLRNLMFHLPPLPYAMVDAHARMSHHCDIQSFHSTSLARLRYGRYSGGYNPNRIYSMFARQKSSAFFVCSFLRPLPVQNTLFRFVSIIPREEVPILQSLVLEAMLSHAYSSVHALRTLHKLEGLGGPPLCVTTWMHSYRYRYRTTEDRPDGLFAFNERLP